jgi:hypothetical protein
MKKKIIIALLAVLVVIQFFRPEKNLSDDNTYDVSTKYPVPENVASILKVACNDCHANKTEYPWYAEVQPIAWWLSSHVNDGKRHLNFSEFTKSPIARQNHKFEETIEMIKEGEMPLASYTWLGLHSGAKLTDEQRQTLVDWAQTQMDSLKAQYPPDSLIMKRRNGPPPKG